MRRSSLPTVKDNLVVTQRSNVRCSHPPNVSRSWSAREIRVRAEERLARSFGDREQERRVLEWCKKNHVNVVRKLPKLDSALLTARGVNTEKFMTIVDEAPFVAKPTRAKPYNAPKDKSVSATQTTYCKFCQREIPRNSRQRRRRSTFQAPYECEHCGASNDINEIEDNVSSCSSDSESTATVAETVNDTIRRGNPAQVIDHRTFPEQAEKSELGDLDESRRQDDEEVDIFWRDDAGEYLQHVEGVDVIDQIEDLSLEDIQESGERSIFLTETSVAVDNDRPAQIKMAWDDEGGNHFAEISRTIVAGDGLQETDDLRNDSYSENSERNSKNSTVPVGVCLFQEIDPASGMTIRVHDRVPRNISENHGTDDVEKRLAFSRENSRDGFSKKDQAHNEHLRQTRALGNSDGSKANELGNDSKNAMIQSPVANRSVGLSRVALMRLTRESRSRSRGGSRSASGTRQGVLRVQEPRTRSHDSYESFLDAVSPEIKSFHARKKQENDGTDMTSQM